MSTDPIAQRLRLLVRAMALAAGAIACFALLGWVLRVDALRQVLPGAIAMNPVTGLCLLAAAAALWLRDATPSSPLGLVLSLLVILGGGSRLVDAVLAGAFAADLLFFADQILGLTPVPRMAYSTAIGLVVIGISLLLYRPGSQLHRLTRSIILPAAAFALLATTGYLYGAIWFYDIPALDPMALNSALALIALCIGTAALPPPLPPVDKLVRDGIVGTTARRLLPAAFLIPFGLGYLRIMGERAGYFDLGFGTSAFVVLTALIFASLVHWSLRNMERAESVQATLQATIKESEQRIFRVLHGLPTGIFVVDPAGNPYYANRKSTELLGVAPRPEAGPDAIPAVYQAYSKATRRLLTPDQVPVLRALRGEEVYTTDVEIHRPDRVVPLEVWAAPIRNGDGRIEFAVATFNDITDRLAASALIDELNTELHRQVDELGVVNKELETFSYSVSHDLRAPLRAVDGFSKVLEEDYAASLGAEGQRLLGRIRSNVQRMGALIDDLLRFSRLSRKSLEAATVDMDSLVSSVVEELRRTREWPGEITIGALPPARGDIDLLRQVWINLIDNALKYSGKRAHPQVTISGSVEHEVATYSVRDNGVGFDMAYADKLFAVFQRLHRQDEFEGTGVGLAIVHRIIHRHGGRVWAHASPDQGAEFQFTLSQGEVDGGH